MGIDLGFQRLQLCLACMDIGLQNAGFRFTRSLQRQNHVVRSHRQQVKQKARGKKDSRERRKALVQPLERSRLGQETDQSQRQPHPQSAHERRSWIKLAHDFGYEAHAVFFDVPPEVCIERNRRRDRNVPEDVMQRMAAKLRPPKFEEGFAKITVVRLKKKDGDESPAEPPRSLEAQPDEEPEPPNLEDAEY